MKNEAITAAQRELIRTDETLQELIGNEIGKDPHTIYQWALHFPDRFEKAAAAMKVIREYKPSKKEAV